MWNRQVILIIRIVHFDIERRKINVYLKKIRFDRVDSNSVVETRSPIIGFATRSLSI